MSGLPDIPLDVPSDVNDVPPLIVEERICASLASMVCLKRIALLAQEQHGIPLFDNVWGLARVTRQFAVAAERHLRAIKRALPASATNLDAPDPKEGV
jgi:hypothetical protein